MPNVKISDMTPGAALDGSELLEMVQGAGTFSTDIDAIRTFIGSAPMTFIGGTVLVSTPVWNGTQTWNDAAVTFTGWKLNITSTASAAASMLMDLQVAGTTQFNVGKTGIFRGAGTTVAALPAAGTAGRRTHVTDSNAALTAGIGAVVAGGGANVVPVFDDGTNWRIG